MVCFVFERIYNYLRLVLAVYHFANNSSLQLESQHLYNKNEETNFWIWLLGFPVELFNFCSDDFYLLYYLIFLKYFFFHNLFYNQNKLYCLNFKFYGHKTRMLQVNWSRTSNYSLVGAGAGVGVVFGSLLSFCI